MTTKAMPPNFNTGWEYIPGASKFEINREEVVRQCGNKKIVTPQKDGTVLLFGDEKKLDTFNPKEIAAQLFKDKPVEDEQHDNQPETTNQNQSITMAKKGNAAKKPKAAKKEKAVKAELKLNATQQKLVDNKELSKSEKIRSLHKDGLSQPHIAQALKLDHPQMVWNVLNAKPKEKKEKVAKAPKEKKAKAAKAPKKKAEKVAKPKAAKKKAAHTDIEEPSAAELEAIEVVEVPSDEEILSANEEESGAGE